MLASAILVLDILVDDVTAILMDTWRPLRVFGHPVDSLSLTLQELLMLALVALAADGVTEWLTGRRITRLLIGIVSAALGSFLLLALPRAPAPLGLVIENVVVIPLCVGAMLLIVVCLWIRTRRLQQLSAVRIVEAYKPEPSEHTPWLSHALVIPCYASVADGSNDQDGVTRRVVHQRWCDLLTAKVV